MTADIHGGWTLDNAKAQLNEFLQRRKAGAAQYRVDSSGPAHDKTFVAYSQVYVQEFAALVKGRGEGSTRKVAETSCALSIVRQMYHKGIIKKCGEVQSKKKVVTNVSTNIQLLFLLF